MAIGTPFQDTTLPAGGTLAARAISLSPGEPATELTPAGFEVIYLVVEGSVEISLFGGLHGTIQAGTYVHVRDRVRHELSATQPGKVLRMDCGFTAWRGVPVGSDAE